MLLGNNLFDINRTIVDNSCAFNSQMLLGTNILISLPMSLKIRSNSLILKKNNELIHIPLQMNVY